MVRNIEEAIATPLPRLRDYPGLVGDVKAYALTTIWMQIIVQEVADFFNVGKNLSKSQIRMTAELILENFAHLTLADFRLCFRRAMLSEHLYDRLDGNIICGWLKDYDAERNAVLEQIYERQDREQYQPDAPAVGTTLEEYTNRVVARIAQGDKTAVEELANIQQYIDLSKRVASSQQLHKKDIEFRRRYLTEYLKQRILNDTYKRNI